MARSWKQFVKKEDSPSQDSENAQSLSGIEKELTLSLEELAESNEQLKAVLQEREALEEKMRQLVNPSADAQPGPRFGAAIAPIGQKRREDQERFNARKKLEEKLRNKKKLEDKIKLKEKEFDAWTKKIDVIRQKVNRTKESFRKKKEEVEKFKKQAGEFERKLKTNLPDGFEKKFKTKTPDGFDYEKIGGSLKKAVGNLSFDDKMAGSTDEAFNKSLDAVRKKVTEQPAVKKVADTWEDLKDKKREAAKVASKFERLIEQKNKIQEFKDKFDKFSFDPDKESIEEVFADEIDAVEKAIERKTGPKKSLFERLLEKRKQKKAEKEGGTKRKKEKGFSTDDLDKEQRENTGGEDSGEKESNADDDFEKREKSRKERRAERKMEKKLSRFNDSTNFESADNGKENAGNEEKKSSEAALKKKQEQEELEKREQQRQEKINERMAERREARREEKRQERTTKIKDKFE